MTVYISAVHDHRLAFSVHISISFHIALVFVRCDSNGGAFPVSCPPYHVLPPLPSLLHLVSQVSSIGTCQTRLESRFHNITTLSSNTER